MTTGTEVNRSLEEMIREFPLRVLVPNWSDFDVVWEIANKICDRYELRKPPQARRPADPISQR